MDRRKNILIGPYKSSKILLFCFTVLILSSCLFKKSKITADQAYKHKQYAFAISLYQDNIKDGIPLSDLDVYQLANAYNLISEYDNALSWYQKAYKRIASNQYGISYANALMKSENYSKAIAIYKKVLNAYGENKDLSRKIFMCKEALKWKKEKETNPYKVSNSDLNSEYSDYSPQFFESTSIVFSSDRNESTGNGTFEWTGNAFSDLYIYSNNSSDIRTFDLGVNTEHNEGVVCFNKSYDQMFFTRCSQQNDGNIYCKLMFTTYEDLQWTEPEKIQFFDDNVNEVHPCLIISDSVLVFSANPIGSKGGYDLYYSSLENGQWTAAIPMPDYLNTVGDEKFANADVDTLYFSSDFLPGMGGLDIFKTFLKPGGKWSLPKNLRAPINSGYDDFSYIVDPNFVPNSKSIQSGYFTSDRIGGFGMDDIYRFVKTKPQISTEPKDTIVKNYNVFILVSVTGTDGNPIGKVQVSMGKDQKKETDDNGKLFFTPKLSEQYRFFFSKDSYLSSSQDLLLKKKLFENLTNDTTINISIQLEKYQTTEEIVLENIYYDYNKYNLRPAAKKSLLGLVKLLDDNPKISIELASHTDCRGKDDYNLILSQNRAKAVIDFLESKGIAFDRLEAIGYGESSPVVDCPCRSCTEEQYQKNRRTSFKIKE